MSGYYDYLKHTDFPRYAKLMGLDEKAVERSATEHYSKAVALDDMLSSLPRLDFVKMDIEGHEPAALRGMHGLIERHRPTLLVEFNPRCLAVQSEDPIPFLRRLLEGYPHVRVISQFDDDATFERAEDVVEFWRRRDKELTREGKLPHGLLHFDLVLRRG